MQGNNHDSKIAIGAEDDDDEVSSPSSSSPFNCLCNMKNQPNFLRRTSSRRPNINYIDSNYDNTSNSNHILAQKSQMKLKISRRQTKMAIETRKFNGMKLQCLVVATLFTLILYFTLPVTSQRSTPQRPSVDQQLPAPKFGPMSRQTLMAPPPLVDSASTTIGDGIIADPSLVIDHMAFESRPLGGINRPSLVSTEDKLSTSSSSSSFVSSFEATIAEDLSPNGPEILATTSTNVQRPARQILSNFLQPTSATSAALATEDPLNSEGSTTSGSSITTLTPQSLTQIEAEEANDANLLSQPFDYHANMPVITKRELTNAIKLASQSIDSSARSGQNQQVNSLDFGSPSWLASSMFHKPVPDSRAMNQTIQAQISEEATRILAKQYKLNRVQTLRGLPLISVDQTNLGKLCQRSSRAFNCIAGQYRSLTGHCNNVQNPDWGSAQTPLIRYAPARYLDHVSKPIKSLKTPVINRNLLPSGRAVSMALYNVDLTTGGPVSGTLQAGGIGQQHSHMTTMLSFFGQFLFHDLVYVSQYTSSQNQMIKCCGLPASSAHPECMPIELRMPNGGENYCLDYVRSTPAIRAGCNLGPRDQLNLASSFLDGSQIYGSNEAQARRLRTFSGGRLRSQRVTIPGSGAGGAGQAAQLELLPKIKLDSTSNTSADAIWSRANEDCKRVAQMKQQVRSSSNSEATNDQCFQTGDDRANENIGLTLMHTIWMREHNYIADKLAQLNKHWRDERVFEETRRLVIAELQHITFTEFLPSILSEEVMQRFNLSSQTQGYSQNYDPQLNAGISTEIATAVLPFILSTIPMHLERYSDRLEMLGSTLVADTFMDGSELFKRNMFAQYLMGMISQNAMEPATGTMPMTMDMDKMVSNLERSAASRSRRQVVASSGNVTQSRGGPPQVDAVALTIQQGRDHGLKPYLYWRRLCQLRPAISDWNDLVQVMAPEVVERLKQVYASVEQLDLYLAVLETPLAGATVGPTFVCLLARQFYHLKHGDRYWYENDLPGSSFSPSQLDEIRQTSLAKVMCRNSQSSINFIQPAPMLASDPFLNAYQYCTNKAMVQLDLSKWRQPVTSAQQFDDELMMGELDQAASSLIRGKRMIESNLDLIQEKLERAKRDLDSIAHEETVKLRRYRRSTNGAHITRGGGGHQHSMMGYHGHANQGHGNIRQGHSHAGYRYLPRLKRQALKINNQSLIFELATNEVVRSLVHQGKDREQAQSIQNDIRDFLFSLETIQLDNLLDNSGESNRLQEFIQMAGGHFLTPEQRTRLLQANDPTVNIETSASSTTSLERSNTISANCQDDDRAFPCDHTSPFRTLTGWCNNLQAPKFGQSFTALDRLLPNAYEDGLSKPRQFSVVLASSQTGERLELPSARLISTSIHDDRSQLHVRYSLALMQFGQFGVDHDLTRTPFSVALDGSLLDCSPCDSKRTVHRDCMPIEIPDNDAHFQSQRARELTGNGRKCLHFVRSLNGQTGLGPRQQINALTAYMDASEIYGSDNCEAKSLRLFQGGKLNSTASFSSTGVPLREILPVTTANPECVTPNGFCFHAGDQRASEQPGLTSIHTVFMRLHNSIVGQLAQVNKNWSDEKLYQHGRRIVAAIMQRITYNEFAPRILGLDYMSKFDLMLKNVGYSNQYDETCSASILTEFAAAAFRMGHSLIRNSFPLLNKQFKPIGKAFQLRKAFFNSQRILTEPSLIDALLRGIVSTPIESLDNSVTEELTNHLFEKPKEPFSGMDLISLNIQRARDHGISGYNNYRAKCNLTRARNFDDLTGDISPKLVKRLSQIYASVDDIDLFTGGMSEQPVHGGIIGPTLGCIIGLQLQRLKKCDRFWHETDDPYIRFSPAQLAEIRKMTLAKVFCKESDHIDMIQRNAMDVPDNFL